MTIEIYLDAINGSDTSGNGSETSPYKTLQYFCDSVAVKNNSDYKVILNKGIYEITNGNIFGQFNSGNMTIIGKGENTEIIQRVYMYQNSIGGSVDFSLLISKCKYNILTTLTGANVNGFRWKWSFYNVLFEYTPNNQTSVFSTSSKELVFRNCVKLTNTTSFLRKNSSIISVYDSMGYFTSGYQTTQADWDKGGNIIGSIDNYMEVLNYQGEYAWITSKSLILHDGEYKKFNKATEKVDAVYKNKKMHSPANSDNTLEEGILFTSDIDKYSEIYKMFQESNSFESTKGLSEVFYGIVFNKLTNIDSYTIKNVWGFVNNSSHGLSSNKQIPYNWFIEISNDTTNGTDGTWQAIDNKTAIRITTDNTVTKYTLSKSYDTKAIRLRSYGYNLESFSGIAISELSFYGNELVSPEIPYSPAFWSTVSSALPTSAQFIEQGMDSLTPLLDRKVTTLESMEMTNKSEILGVGETGKVFSKTIDLKKYIDIRSIRVEVK